MCFPISTKKTNIWGQNFLQQQQISDKLQNDTINIVFSILDLTHPQWKDSPIKIQNLLNIIKKKNIFRTKDQIWYTCIKLGVKVHHVLESPPPPCLHIEVKSIYEATKFLARNVSPSWRVILGFLFLFCRSYSGRCTSSGRPPTHRRCSCWQGASLWTCTRCCSVTEREKREK